jgi:hypothetical protein
MHPDRTTTTRSRTRGTALAGAAAAVVTAAAATGVALAAVASATPPPAAAPSGPTSSTTATTSMATVWAQAEPATREVLCTAFTANPDGMWQSIAPVLTGEGIGRAEAFALLTDACAEAVSVADLRG